MLPNRRVTECYLLLSSRRQQLPQSLGRCVWRRLWWAVWRHSLSCLSVSAMWTELATSQECRRQKMSKRFCPVSKYAEDYWKQYWLVANSVHTTDKTRQSCFVHVNQALEILTYLVGPRGSAVERQSLASVLSPSCARPVADGWPLMWVSRPL